MKAQLSNPKKQKNPGRPDLSVHPYMGVSGNHLSVYPYMSAAGPLDPYMGIASNSELIHESEGQREKKWVRWSDAEDDRLRAAIAAESNPPNWKLISKKYFGVERNDIQCKNRWKKSLQPGLIKGSWTKEEDAVIRNCVSMGIKKWSDIAKRLPGRIGDQVKERWNNSLDPVVKKGMWTQEEIRLLHEMQVKYGNQWSKIAEFIPGRSENSVKNRWYNEKTSRKRAMKRQLAAAATAATSVQVEPSAYVPQQVPFAAVTNQPAELTTMGSTAEHKNIEARDDSTQEVQLKQMTAEESAAQQVELASEATETQQV